jgi:hypothetical protein
MTAVRSARRKAAHSYAGHLPVAIPLVLLQLVPGSQRASATLQSAFCSSSHPPSAVQQDARPTPARQSVGRTIHSAAKSP